MSGGSISLSGKDTPSTEGVGYGRQVFSTAQDAERIFALGQETGAVLVRANPDNSDDIYVGFDDDVDNNNGFPLQKGESIEMDMDIDKQNLWGYAMSANDDVRFLLIE